MKAMKATLSGGAIAAKIAEKTELKPKVVKAVFNELNAIAQSEVKKNEKFTIPQLVVLKLKHKPARKAGMKVMFGKEVRVDLSARRCYSWLCRGRPLALTYAGGGSWRKLYNALAPAWCHIAVEGALFPKKKK